MSRTIKSFTLRHLTIVCARCAGTLSC